MGEVIKVFMITSSGSEGINLRNTRYVHIMEPYWNKVRLDQVKGRAIRICSHQDLPFKERDVEIYTYYTVFSTEQKNKSKIDMTLRTTDENETSDEKVYNVSLRKDKVNQEIVDLMKECAVDCGLNSADNGDVSCFVVDGKPDQYMFDPDLEYDKILTSIELKQEEKVKKDVMETERVVSAAVGEAPKAPAGPPKDKYSVIKFKGVEYFIAPKPGSGGLIFNIHMMADKELKQPVGEIAINPATGTFKGSLPTFKA